MDPTTDAPTQGTDAAEPQGEQPQGQQEAQVSGFQKRIDELTAVARGAERRADALASQLADQLARAGQAQQAPVEPASEDPEQRILQQMKKMQEGFEKRFTQLGASVAATQATRLAAPGENPAIVARAEALAAGWTEKGLPFQPADALTFARGEFYSNPANRVAARAPARVAGSNPVLTPGSAAYEPAPRHPSLPANLDQLSPDAQYEALDKAGIGDQEF